MTRVTILMLLLLAPLCANTQDFSPFDSAMSQLHMTRGDIRFDQDEMAGWGGDHWRLSFFTMFHHDPFKLPKYGQINLDAFAANSGSISALIADAGRKIDCPVRRGLIGDALEKYTTARDSQPLPSFTRKHSFLTDPEFDLLRRKVDLLCAAVTDSEFSFTLALGAANTDRNRRQLFTYFVADSQKYNDLVEELATEVDFNRLVAGAEDLAEALRRIADSLEFCTFPKARRELSTRQGLIVIGTAGHDDYAYAAPPLLILDPGGDDTYRISGFATGYPLGAIIDAAGNDTYQSADSTAPGIAGAVLGMSVVIDKAGDDFYDARHVAQGCGIFGVGVVMDNNGTDRYRARSYAQGCGVFGIGILSDSTGTDSLYCWANSQGYGYTKGCGLCINYSGDDSYVAQDSLIFSPGQQTQDHNSSLAQGCGFGKRADYVDGHSWAGGVGILCDVSGNDSYTSGLFAQGCGYWFAVGMLLDGAGDDHYLSPWYTLGSGAHFAVGYLDDFAGNDVYNATMAMSVGSGHDFTIGYLNDRAGNDAYTVPGLSAGGGNFQGIGIFHDWSGDDSYTTSGAFILGGANGLQQGPRAYLNTFGIFVDGGGSDTYDKPWAKNGTRWISPKVDSTKPGPYEIGVGIDE